MALTPANDSHPTFRTALDLAQTGQALTLIQPHRRFGRCYGEFVRHAGDGKHVYVRKLISSMRRARWTKPIMVDRALVSAVHATLARTAEA